jgi:hypothetical protein
MLFLAFLVSCFVVFYFSYVLFYYWHIVPLALLPTSSRRSREQQYEIFPSLNRANSGGEPRKNPYQWAEHLKAANQENSNDKRLEALLKK